MANSENLKPMNKRTKSEQREIAQKAGIKSGEKRRERKKLLRELLELALQETDTKSGQQNDISITAALIKKAAKGDVNAYLAIRDTLGEKPIDKQEVKINPITIKDDI